MYLSKIELDRSHPSVRKCLTNCQYMHQNIMRYFGTSRAEAQTLYRLNEASHFMSLYLLSAIKPCQTDQPGMTLTGCRDIAGYMEQFKKGMVCGFNINAMPTKKVKQDGQKNSKRRIIRDEAERLAWLERKALEGGFSILQVQENGEIHQFGQHSNGNGGKMWMGGYNYQGVLRIEDEDKFKQTYCDGLGPGRAYGFGMLLLR